MEDFFVYVDGFGKVWCMVGDDFEFLEVYCIVCMLIVVDDV